MTIGCNIWMICLILNWFCYGLSRMFQLPQFVWVLRSSVWDVFINFLLIDATDRSKISSDEKVLYYQLSTINYQLLTILLQIQFAETCSKELSIVNYQPLTVKSSNITLSTISSINYQLSNINYKLSTINYLLYYQLSTINYQLSTINY